MARTLRTPVISLPRPFPSNKFNSRKLIFNECCPRSVAEILVTYSPEVVGKASEYLITPYGAPRRIMHAAGRREHAVLGTGLRLR